MTTSKPKVNDVSASPFSVLNGHDHSAKPQPAMPDALSEKSRALEAARAKLEAEEQQLRTDRAQAEAEARQEKQETRAGLLEDIADWRNLARDPRITPEQAKEFFAKAREAEAEALKLGVELGLATETPPVQVAAERPAPTMSSNMAFVWTVVLFIASLIATAIYGLHVTADPSNSSGTSIFVNAPLRALVSFSLTFMTVLIAFFFIRLFFPDIYRIWHNQVDTERSFQSLLQEAPAWAILGGLLALLFLFSSLFAGFYQAIYA